MYVRHALFSLQFALELVVYAVTLIDKLMDYVRFHFTKHALLYRYVVGVYRLMLTTAMMFLSIQS